MWRSANKLFQLQVLMVQARSQLKDQRFCTLLIMESWLQPVQFSFLLPRFRVIPSPHLDSAVAQSRPGQKSLARIHQLPFDQT